MYKPKNIKLHKLRGDYTSWPSNIKISRHHLCQFCDIWFYDLDQLYTHCKLSHLYCPVCEETNFSFYINYTELEKHFKNSHFVCHQKDCSADQYTNVFKTHNELAAHLKAQHNITLKKSFGKGKKLNFHNTKKDHVEHLKPTGGNNDKISNYKSNNEMTAESDEVTNTFVNDKSSQDKRIIFHHATNSHEQINPNKRRKKNFNGSNGKNEVFLIFDDFSSSNLN